MDFHGKDFCESDIFWTRCMQSILETVVLVFKMHEIMTKKRSRSLLQNVSWLGAW